MRNVIPFRTEPLYNGVAARWKSLLRAPASAEAGAKPRELRTAVLLDFHAAGEPIIVAVIVADGFFRIAPAVVAFAVVEVDEPEPFDLQPQRLDLLGPTGDDVAE